MKVFDLHCDTLSELRYAEKAGTPKSFAQNDLQYNMRPEQIHYDIADWAIAGNRLMDLGQALWFFNPFSASCRQNFPSSKRIKCSA